MRNFFAVILLLMWLNIGAATEWEDKQTFTASAARQTLRVLSSTDTSVFKPIIERFTDQHPDLSVEYLVASSSDVYENYRQSPDTFDVVISSAMDLQLKLVNDGYAYQVPGLAHPQWAQWRRSIFGFTLEPAAIVINRKAFETLPVPQSRQDMIEVLRANPDTFRGRVGTYDVRQSGLGYLLGTQDARSSETYWRLMEIMGGLNARLYCCSGDMIEDLAKGTIAISYNVLGSYANARDDLADQIEVILPSDFPTTMMRTALVSGRSSRKDGAVRFLEFLTSSAWLSPERKDHPLPALGPDTTQRSAIALDPGLMIFLDRMKRQIFLNAWENAVIQ